MPKIRLDKSINVETRFSIRLIKRVDGSESRATSISGPGVSQANVYNGLDTRVSSTTNFVSNTFLRDGAYVTDPVVKDSNATYTPGLYERRAGSTRQLHHNLKNVELQTTLTPAVSASRTYDAFGNVLSSTGPHRGPFGNGGGFGYQQDATGLKLLGHRLYDSSTGRFLTRDPIKDGRNWYVYCAGNPVGFADPTGLFTVLGFEFSGQVVSDGLTTGLHGAASGMTFGLYDGGSYKDSVGFGVSKGLGAVGSVSLIAAGAVAIAPAATLVTVPQGATLPILTGTGAVIGNGSAARVQPVARQLAYKFFEPTTDSRIGGWFQNLHWMLKQIYTVDNIVDIGPRPGLRPQGPWYIMERIVTQLLCRGGNLVWKINTSRRLLS